MDEAERQIRQAIRVNPNHLKSRLLLGRILLESGSEKRVTESVEVLEAAYGYDPASALPDLIKTLLALAGMQADDGRQLKLYDRILQLQPGQPAALERQKAVWKTRGEDALKRGELEEALNAFQNSGEELQALRVRQLMARTLLIPLLESARQHESRNDWEQAISLYRSLFKQYPDDQELLERMKTAHNQAKAFQLETARQYERRNEWMQAVSLY